MFNLLIKPPNPCWGSWNIAPGEFPILTTALDSSPFLASLSGVVMLHFYVSIDLQNAFLAALLY